MVWYFDQVGLILKPHQVGVEVGQMVERVDSVLHQEDFSLEEVKHI